MAAAGACPPWVHQRASFRLEWGLLQTLCLLLRQLRQPSLYHLADPSGQAFPREDSLRGPPQRQILQQRKHSDRRTAVVGSPWLEGPQE